MNDGAYFVIGSDDQRYGPAAEADLDGWMYQGLVSLASLTWRPGESGWIPLRERHESLRAGETRHLGFEQKALLNSLSSYLENHHYVLGTPVEGVDLTKTRMAASVAFAALKFAIKHVTRSSVRGYTRLSGGSGSAEAIAQAVIPLQGLTDLLAIRYDAMRGDRMAVGLIGDALTTVGLEAHRRLIVDVGYRRSRVAGGWSFMHATICDVSRRLVESSPPKGFFSGLQRATGMRPFSLQDLHEVLGGRLEFK